MPGKSKGLALFLVLLLCPLLVFSASSALFCKCICNKNSTIIELNPTTDSSAADPDAPSIKRKTCADCNKSFCLEYHNLPFCKDVADEDVSTDCFQRDSAKDRAVIYSFIFVTVGLLVYSTVRPYVEKKAETVQSRHAYGNLPSTPGPE